MTALGGYAPVVACALLLAVSAQRPAGAALLVQREPSVFHAEARDEDWSNWWVVSQATPRPADEATRIRYHVEARLRAAQEGVEAARARLRASRAAAAAAAAGASVRPPVRLQIFRDPSDRWPTRPRRGPISPLLWTPLSMRWTCAVPSERPRRGNSAGRAHGASPAVDAPAAWGPSGPRRLDAPSAPRVLSPVPRGARPRAGSDPGLHPDPTRTAAGARPHDPPLRPHLRRHS